MKTETESVYMTYFDDQLRELNAQVIQKRRVESKLKELSRQQEELEPRVRQLDGIRLSEQSDVDRLEGRSLAVFFYNIVGKKGQKLDKERLEAFAAQVKYDAAYREISAVTEEIKKQNRELERLSGCERKYEETLRAKAEKVKKSESEDAEKIINAEADIDCLENQMKEIGEAIQASKAALDTVYRIIEELESAESWGTWDLFGGGLVSDIAKHSHLDDAQELVEQLQVQLRLFKTELADVEIEADMQVSIDGFLRFSDYFFDGLFADWTVLDKIKKSLEQVKATHSKIISVTDKLESMKLMAETELKSEKYHLDGLIEEAVI